MKMTSTSLLVWDDNDKNADNELLLPDAWLLRVIPTDKTFLDSFKGLNENENKNKKESVFNRNNHWTSLQESLIST